MRCNECVARGGLDAALVRRHVRGGAKKVLSALTLPCGRVAKVTIEDGDYTAHSSGPCFYCICKTGSSICDPHKSPTFPASGLDRLIESAVYYLNRQINEKAKEAYLRKWIDAFQRATGIPFVFSKAKYDRAVASPDNAPEIDPLSIRARVDVEDPSEEEEEEAIKTSKGYAAPGRKAKTNKRAGRGSRKRDRSTSSSGK